ncbi:unnamed protein product [Polarella glacialis]|uniref:MYND-type domain-containing protein n=1 Tax=Polarella glacialis TaxID=89957 RepID=A0A813LZ62_POLGL|nr:unnamed protein product [Polarella glacialis]
MVVCLGCSAPNPPIRCSGCQVARFCCKACQRQAWVEHRQFCGGAHRPWDPLSIAREAALLLGSDAPEELLADAAVQAEVLEKLGFRRGGVVVGQRLLSDRCLWDFIIRGQTGLALQLFGRNCFRCSYLPALRSLTQDTKWPIVMSSRQQGHITELPTLELCAALVTRLLCCARRLRQEGHRRLVWLGIGSGDALVEASVALHLAAVLGVAIDLHSAAPLRFLWRSDFEICIVATDCPEKDSVRLQNRTSQAPQEMKVLELDRREAVRRFAAEAPVYVFSCWMPMRACWCSEAVEDAGSRLVEMCFLSAPPSLIKVPTEEIIRPSSAHLGGTQELFPKTLCRWDFLAQGLNGNDGGEVGLFHSHLFLLSVQPSVPAFLAEPLVHGGGCYAVRMADDQLLNAVDVCRGVGLYHIHGPADFDAEVPPLPCS